MKITTILLLFALVQVSAETYSQTKKLTLNLKNTPLAVLFEEIEKVSEFNFFYDSSGLDLSRNVTVTVKDSNIEAVLDMLFSDSDISYEIFDRFIILRSKEKRNTQERSFAVQQERSVSGKVTDSEGQSLPGATVAVKGTTKGTVTNAEGEYLITNIPDDATLVFSFVGMLTQEVVVGSQTSINVEMDVDAIGIEEVVAIGYGTQKKESLTSAISSMNAENIESIPTSNLSNVLAGRLSGTFVQSSTGTPGISSNIRIRGISSWNGGSPIYVIDGIVRDKTSFDALDPNEVENITILKDAASAAIYGSRSSNGVVLVNTKTGKAGKMVVQYSSVLGTQRTGKLPEYMDMREALNLHRSINGGMSDEEIEWALKTNPGGMNYYNAAYQDPSSQKHAVSVSGGNEKVLYYIGGSFYDEDGFLPNVWYKKYNLRGNVSVNVTKDLTVKLNLSNSYGQRNRFNFTYDYGSADLNNLWGKLLYWDVFVPPYIDEKPVNPGWLGNPVEMMKSGGYWRNKNQQVDGLLNVEYKIPFVKGLSAGATYSKNMDNSYIKNFAQKQLLYNFKTTGENNLIRTNEILGSQMSGDPGTEYIGNEYRKSDAYQFNVQVNYDRHFEDHHINATAVYEQYEYQHNFFSMYRYNFPLYPKDQFFAASKDNKDWSTNGNEAQDGRLSYIGRVNYEFADKYMFSASIRYDGSIKFSPEQRWGLFPSVSAGWLISNENFFVENNSLNFFEVMKIRFSYGATGNDAIGGWQWADQYNIQSSSYYMGSGGGISAPRLAYGGIPNDNLTWEKSDSYNLGFDLRFLNHISFTADLWKRHTYDILGARILVLPSEFGGSLPATNYGEVNSKGLEIELGYNNNIGSNFSYNVKANFGLATTEVIKRDYASNAQPVDIPIGKTLSYGTGYEALDLFRTQADLDQLPDGYTIFGTTPELGMMNFADISGPDGIPDNKIDGYDRIVLGEYMGSGSAPISYGMLFDLSYKNFNINMLFSGLAGFKLTYNDAWGRNYGGGGKVPLYHADSWSAENPDGSTPKLYSWGDGRTSGYTQASTFNTYDGSFVRMKNLNVGYTFELGILEKAGVSKAQLFASATNLFYLSKFKFYDPEISQFMSYPLMKSYSLGLNIQF